MAQFDLGAAVFVIQKWDAASGSSVYGLTFVWNPEWGKISFPQSCLPMMDYSNIPGVALYIDPTKRDSGWACLAKGEPQWTQGPPDLTSAGVWLVNLNYQDFRLSGLIGSDRFRPNEYLRTHLYTLAAELGLCNPLRGAKNPTYHVPSTRENVVSLADFFGNVMEACWALGVRGFPPGELRRGFRDAFYHLPRQSILSEEVNRAVVGCLQPFTQSERRRMGRRHTDDEVIVSLVRHRYAHAVEILREPVPVGPWRSAPSMTPTEILAHRLPLILRVQVHSSDERVGAVVNYGGRQRTFHRVGSTWRHDARPREFMTLPEYQFMIGHAEITVMEIFEGTRYIDNPMMKALSQIQTLQRISPAFLLCCELIWSACLKNADNLLDQSPPSAWVQAHDRILCIKDALSVLDHDNEADVQSFAYGAVRFTIPDPKANLTDWYRAVTQGNAFQPHLCKGQSIAVDHPVETEDMAQFYRAMLFEGDLGTLLSTDAAALEEYSGRANRQRQAGARA